MSGIFGGGGGPTSSTVTQSNIPDWLRPQVEGMLGQAAQSLFQTTRHEDPETGEVTYDIGAPKPYTPYSASVYQGPSGWETVAGLTPGQQQAINVANWMNSPAGQQFQNEQYGRAGGFAEQAGYGGKYFSDLAQGYGSSGAAAGAAGQQLGVTGGGLYGGMGAGYGTQAAGLAPRAAGLGGMYEQMATTPGEQLKYMSPYQQAVTAQQQAGAIRQKQVADQARKAAAARAGAFGGGRQAIESAEADRALQTQLGNIEAQGLQSAYQQAQQNILNRAQLESQGLGQAGQLYGVGMQGAGLGLQGLQSQLAGTAQGMQGAGMGLQGIQSGLAGLGLTGQMGGQLADITGKRLQGLMSGAQFQYGMNEQQRQLAQQALNQQIQNYAMQQETPYQRLAAYNALIRGYAQPGQTMTQYQAPPSGISQLASLGTAGIGLNALGNLAGINKKEGGTVHSGHGLDRLALRNALAGN